MNQVVVYKSSRPFRGSGINKASQFLEKSSNLLANTFVLAKTTGLWRCDWNSKALLSKQVISVPKAHFILI